MPWCWSLAVEEQFYLLFPIILLMLVRRTDRGMRWLAVFFVGSMVVRAGILLSDQTIQNASLWQCVFDEPVTNRFFAKIYDNLHTRYVGLLCGVVGAMVCFFQKDATSRFVACGKGRFCTYLSLSVIVLLMIVPGFIYSGPIASSRLGIWMNTYLVLHRHVFCVAILVVLVGTIEPKSRLQRWITSFLSLRLWFPIAQLSYSFYLFHLFAIYGIFDAFVGKNDHAAIATGAFHEGKFVVLSASAFAIAMLMSLASYLLVERPLMNVRR